MPNNVEYLFLCVYGPSVYFGEVSLQIFCSFFVGCLWSPEFLKFFTYSENKSTYSENKSFMTYINVLYKSMMMACLYSLNNAF